MLKQWSYCLVTIWMKETMFDPFNDFETAGYLRNVRKDKNEDTVKNFEHNLFRANLPDALVYLSGKKVLTYHDFLEVHRTLFLAYYPWSGQDRATTMPASAVSKAGIFFSHPNDAKRAVDAGLRLGQSKVEMNKKPGEVMGLFAYGHPFLDGNGRTMLIVHSELCYRAGFSIDWNQTSKADYLNALSDEIRNPGHGVLDSYLLPFKSNRLDRESWSKSFLSIKGLDGLDNDNQVEGDLSDATVAEKYRQFEQQRGYSYQSHDEQIADPKKQMDIIATARTEARKQYPNDIRKQNAVRNEIAESMGLSKQEIASLTNTKPKSTDLGR